MDVSHNPQTDAAKTGGASVRVQPVILAGGSGTRLWPLSRQQFPKQLIELVGAESLLEATLRRLDGLDGLDATTHGRDTVHFATANELIVVCGTEHKLLTAQQIERNGRRARIVLEPCARNTAPAMTLAALAAQAAVAGGSGSDPVIVAMPADHAVSDLDAFRRTVAKAIEHAASGALVTLGIVPDKIETGYGYIKAGATLGTAHDGAPQARVLERFVEKPRRELAEQYLVSGEYWWNSGIFVCRASVWLAAIEHFQPAIHAACVIAFERGLHQDGFTQLDVEAFEACPSDSIDFASQSRGEEDRVPEQPRALPIARDAQAHRQRIGDERILERPQDEDGAEEKHEFPVIRFAERAREQHVEQEIAQAHHALIDERP